MTDRRDPSGSHLLLPPHPPLVREDITGSHRAQLPPDSDPPVSARGLSWKAILSVASILVALVGSVGTYLYTHAEAEADSRARHREVIARLDRIEDDVSAIAGQLAQHETQLHEHSTRMAVLVRDVEVLERELEKMERRRRGER
jgi:hypothetical protein